jgi:hypothetical protein
MNYFRFKISFATVLTIVVLAIIASGCKDNENPIKFPEGTFPDSVYNITGLNTAYDDYNSNLYIIGASMPIIFSSNRKTSGGTFDLVQGSLWFQFDQTNGNFAVGGDMTTDQFYTTVVNKANTAGNDYGPYSIFSSTDGFEYLFTSAATAGSPLDLQYVKNLPKFGSTIPDVYGPYPARVLNSDSTDAYLCFDINEDSAYFCSNRGGKYDIYVQKKPTANLMLDAWMNQSFNVSNAIDSVNSPADDKCPFIYRNIMIFASNRDDGEGGYDLYYSVFRKGKWSSAVNLGPRVNTPADEFRPLIGYHSDFTNKMIVFSSNREGGAGGFDLYFTGYTFPSK